MSELVRPALSPTILEYEPSEPITVALGKSKIPSGPTSGPGLLHNQEQISIQECMTPLELVEALKEGRAQAAVRGDLPAGEVKSELARAFGFEPTQSLDRAVLVELAGGLRLVGPVGIDEGQSLEDRQRLAEKAVDLMIHLGRHDPKRPKGWQPKVAVLSLGRPEDHHRSDQVRHSLKQGEALVSTLTSQNIKAKHYGIEIERAAREAEVLITPDGTHGNLIFRTLHFLGGVKAWGAPALALWPEVVFVDSSRARADFEGPVRLAAMLVD